MTCRNSENPVNGCQLVAGLFIPSCIRLVSYLFFTLSLCVINGTGLSLQCWECVLSSLRYFYLFHFAWTRAVNNASQPATCTVFIISMQPELSAEYLWVPAKCLWCYLFMLLLSIIHLFIYSWKNYLKLENSFLLKGTWPNSIPSLHNGKGGGGASGLLVIALYSVSLDSPEDVIFIQADRSADTRRGTGRETHGLRWWQD